MAIKVQNNGGKGNPYHSESNGQFVSQDGGGGANGNENNDANQKPNVEYYDTSKRQTVSNSNPSFDINSVNWDDLFTDDDNNDINKFWNELNQKEKQENFWKERKLMTPDDVVDNIEMFFDDDVIDFMAKYNWQTKDTMGASKTSHRSINEVLTNAIAHRQFNPVNILDKNEFDKIYNKLRVRGYASGRAVPFAEYGFIQRGMHDRNTPEIYLGKRKPDCLLPNGVHGSCIYTAYNSYTAGSYGAGGYVMSFLVDNQKANTIKSSDYGSRHDNNAGIRGKLISKLPETQKKIHDHAIAKGRSQYEADRMSKIYKNTLENDYTFAAILMGYDIVYQEDAQFGLLLNFKNTYTKKDW